VDANFKSQGATAPAMQRMRFAELQHAQKMRQQDETHIQNLLFAQEQAEMERNNRVQ
jgi:hypothetical protein